MEENEREREEKRGQNIATHPFPFSLLFLALLHRQHDLMEAFYIISDCSVPELSGNSLKYSCQQ